MPETFDVLMVGPYPEDTSMIKGGVQASLYGLSRALLARPEVGRAVGVSIPLSAEPDKAVTNGMLESIPVHYLTAPYGFLASSVVHLPGVLRILRTLDNPVVHVHATGLFQASLCALLRIKRIPFAWTLHGITEKEMLQRYREHKNFGNAARYCFYTLLERFTLWLARDIFVDTPYVRDEIRTAAEVHVLPIGIFTEEFVNLRHNPRDTPLILSLGVIDPRKGHHLTLEAFAQVQKAVPDAKLIIAGALTITSYLDELKARTAELGLTDSVEFAINRPRSEIVSMLGQARVFALHSQEESQGIALCEALAAGLPTAATKVGGIPFVITDGADGFLVPYGDVPAFAAVITRLLTDDELYEQMAELAVTSSQRFDWKSIAAEVVKTYRKAIER